MSDEPIDIKGIDKTALLIALYERARPQGLGFLHYTPKPMQAESVRVLRADLADAMLIVHYFIEDHQGPGSGFRYVAASEARDRILARMGR